MGKEIPRSFEKLRSGEHSRPTTFTNVAAAAAAGVTPAKYPGRTVEFTAGGTGGVRCLGYSDGTNWKQIALGANCL
jgi:hypothetical protein